MGRARSVLAALVVGASLASCSALSGLDQLSIGDCPFGCGPSHDGSVPLEATTAPDAADATLTDGSGGEAQAGGSDDASDAQPEVGEDGPGEDASEDAPGVDADAGAEAGEGCTVGLLLCDGGCVSPASPLSCGRCGNVCGLEAGTPSCQAVTDTPEYQCVSGCPTATPTLCGSTCVDTATDPSHCGSCSGGCTTGVAHAHALCGDGGCGFACDTGYVLCNGACVLLTTPANCGACGAACDADGGLPLCAPGADGGPYACASGCPATAPMRCSSACVDLTTDPNNCASCGHACTAIANAHPVCAASACTIACNSGYSLCNGACVDFNRDPNSCGGCGVGHVCGAAQTCTNGACVTPCRTTNDCPTGYACNGSACTTSCSVSQPCHGGCCSGGTCTSGLTAPACGTTGICTNCAAQSSNTACVSGVCGCSAATDCPALESCSNPLHLCQSGVCGGANTGCNGGCCTNLSVGGNCVAGSSDTQCGGAGGQCANCQAGCNPGPRCVNGACGCAPGGIDCLASSCSSRGVVCSDAGACQM